MTGVITASISLLVPASAMADESHMDTGRSAEIANHVSLNPVRVQIETITPLFNKVTVRTVSVPADANVSFDRVAVTSLPNPQIEIDRLAKIEADKKAKEDKEKAEKAKEEAEKKRQEAERIHAAGSIATEYPHFMPSGIEPMSDMDEKLVDIAATGLGSPYVWGGTLPSGWDCSGYVQWVYKQAGIDIPRVNQWEAGKVTTNPVPGDIVVQNGQSHVGIYVGGGMMYSAMNPSDGTKFHPVNIYPSYFVHIDR